MILACNLVNQTYKLKSYQHASHQPIESEGAVLRLGCAVLIFFFCYFWKFQHSHAQNNIQIYGPTKNDFNGKLFALLIVIMLYVICVCTVI